LGTKAHGDVMTVMVLLVKPVTKHLV